MANYRRLKNSFRITILCLLIAYFGGMAAFQMPVVQRKISAVTSAELSRLLQTRVQIESVHLGLLNRIILQNVVVYDRQQKLMLRASRLSAKMNVLAIFNGRIRINSTQLFGLQSYIYQTDKQTPPNIRFLLDAFSSKDKNAPSHLDLKINTILIRRGQIRFDILSEKSQDKRIDLNHLAIKNLSATINLRHLTDDSLHIWVKRLSLQEQSGLQLRKLAFRLAANRKKLKLTQFEALFPHSFLRIDSLSADYNLSQPLDNWLSSINFQTRVISNLVLHDFRFIAPTFSGVASPIACEFSATGKGERISIENCRIVNEARGLFIHTSALIDIGTKPVFPYFFVEIHDARINQHAVQSLYKALSQKNKTSAILGRLADIHFTGDLSGYPNQLTAHGLLQSAVGSINANITMHVEGPNRKKEFSGTLAGERIHLGNLLADNRLGDASFNIELKGFSYSENRAQTYIKGLVSSFAYQNYEYKNITLDGNLRPDGFDGQIKLEDPNANVQIDGSIALDKKSPSFNLIAQVERLRPTRLHLSNRWGDASLSGLLTANFTGRSIDDLKGSIEMDSLAIDAPDTHKSFALSHLRIWAGKTVDAQNRLQIESDFLNGHITGKYAYKTLTNSLIHTAERFFPSLLGKRVPVYQTTNNFRFEFKLHPTDFFNRVLEIPLRLESTAQINGRLDDASQTLQAQGHIPAFYYKQTRYESGSLMCQGTSDHLNLSVRTNMLMQKGAMLNLALQVTGKNDKLQTTLNWGNNTNVTYAGKIDALTTFSRDEKDNRLHTSIRFMPSQVVLKDTIWNLHPSTVQFVGKHIRVNRFLFEHANQHLLVDGIIGSKVSTDSCVARLRDIDIQYVLNMVQFDAVEFDGKASGKIIWRGGTQQTDLQTDLQVKHFTFNKALLGDAHIQGKWDDEIGGMRLKAHMEQQPEDFITHVEGYVSPKLDGLDLQIQAKGTNLAFLQPFVSDIFSNVGGRGSGQVRLFGKFADLDLEGKVKADADFRVNILHTDFTASADSVIFTPSNIRFSDVSLRDYDGNKGSASGEISHNKLHDIHYNFRFTSNHLQVYHTTEPTVDFPFYGRVMATGNVSLRGGDNQLVIDGNLRAENQSTFTYVLGGITQAASNQFITFVDKTPIPERKQVSTELYHYLNQHETPDETSDSEPNTDIHINLQIEPTPAANMRIIMDPKAGDNISGTGTGNLRMTYFNKGKFEIYGNYQIAQGIYKMSLQNVIRKDFSLQPGGIVSFNGDPTQGTMNVQAVYTVNSASLSDLVANASTRQSSVRVNCLLNLTGSIASPDLSFDLELPTVNEEDRQLVRSVVSTREQMNRQIIYLLALGRFYPFDENANAQTNATSSLAINTLSGQLNDIITTALNNQNWNLGTNFRTGERGWNDMEAQAILSGKLLNNRLLINGNFGYKENSVKNTNFVGDFEAIWLLTPNGDLRIRGYNQTNDRYFTKSTLTTQGIGLMYKRDFTDWAEIINWFWRRKKNIPTPTTNDTK